MLLLLLACSDYNLEKKDNVAGTTDSVPGSDPNVTNPSGDPACDVQDRPPEEVTLSDTCSFEIGGFEPVVAWDVPGTRSNALPTVGDLDGDGMPEIVVIFESGLLGPGYLAVYHGDGSGLVWSNNRYNIGYGSATGLADLDDDGAPEIVAVVQYEGSIFGNGDYAVVAFSNEGDVIWESERFVDGEFDYASGPAISDMDHDGEPEIVVGRAILNADGTTRATGFYGRGAPTGSVGDIDEGAWPAVADLDLDGVEEVIVGNAMYSPDGNTLWYDPAAGDGGVSVANLDDDPEGEFIKIAGYSIEARDTNGDLMWGPHINRTANIFPVAAIGDLTGDGKVEIVVAGGNLLWTLDRDGNIIWTASVTDMTGATGASIFDFDADGIPEVVYIDEVEMVAYNGSDGRIKFLSTDHSSVTMYDYPVIADVDNNGHADIVIVSDSASAGLKVFRDVNDSWAPVRPLWNQHAYSITNINDDLSVPETQTQNFTLYNNYHSAVSLPVGAGAGDELEAEILEVCDQDCDRGKLWVLVRGRNTGTNELPAGIRLALYARIDGVEVLVGKEKTETVTPSGSTTEALLIDVKVEDITGAEALVLRVDDDGEGVGEIFECLEDNNEFLFRGPFCE